MSRTIPSGHSEEILREGGYSDADIARLRQAKVI
jgi:hypothetical protein